MHGIISVPKILYLLQLLLQERFHMLGSIVGIDYQNMSKLVKAFKIESINDLDLGIFDKDKNTTTRIGNMQFNSADEIKEKATMMKPLVGMIKGKQKLKKVENKANSVSQAS